ncbi:acyl-coenzyme A synthetase/AMP-(fatty) acid ligase [Bradyrhizobium sp. USDA 4472]
MGISIPLSLNALLSAGLMLAGKKCRSLIVKQPGAQIEVDLLIEYVRSQLARFKAPREIIFTNELPWTALGKLQ